MIKIKNMYFLADIGGTKSRIALSSELKSFTEPLIFSTPKNFRDFISIAKKYIKDFSAGSSLKLAAAGVHGTLEPSKSFLLKAPHLKEWEGVFLKNELEAALSVRCYLENDTAMVGLGESVFGAAKNYKINGYITISTGVGGVKIVNNAIEPHYTGFEPGHQILIIDKKLYTLENLVSGSALKAQYNKQPSEIADIAVWEKVHNYLAIGLANITMCWSPEALVLGGGLVNGNKIVIEKLIKEYNLIYNRIPVKPVILKSELGDLGALWGGMHYLKQLLIQ